MTNFEQQVKSAADKILEDYAQEPMIQSDRPDQDAVIDIVRKLRRIIFPSHFPEKNDQPEDVKHNLSLLIEDVMFRLTEQLELVLRQEPGYDAQQICLEFFRRIPQVREMIYTDLQAAYDGDPAATGTDEILFAYPGLFAVLVYRLAHELYVLGVPMLPRIMTEYAHSQTGIDIHPGAAIGRYFFIDHGTGVVIGQTTVIGDHVKMYQGVTLGGLSTRGGQSLRGKKRHPTIEDSVTIYAGASILGGDTVIGRGCVIGANAFITHSIAPGTTVIPKNQELQLRGNAKEDWMMP